MTKFYVTCRESDFVEIVEIQFDPSIFVNKAIVEGKGFGIPQDTMSELRVRLCPSPNESLYFERIVDGATYMISSDGRLLCDLD